MSLTRNYLQASVIIPTYNRSSTLHRTLKALTNQSIDTDCFEVIVVSDGSTDNPAEVVRQFSSLLQIRLIEQSNSGAATARNRGADAARSKLLIFLDDDTEAQPQFIFQHLQAHSQNSKLVVIGYLPPVLDEQKGYFREELMGWWEIEFQRMRKPGYRFSYTDLLSGNFSISSELFQRAGKFNPALRCREDYDLGARLLALGASFSYCHEAAAFHYEKSNLNRSLQRKYEEGIADVQIGRLYPSLRPTLLMSRLELFSLLPSRILRFQAFSLPFLSKGLAANLLSSLPVFEKIKAYRMWQRVLYGLLGYWYWRGVAKELRNLRELKKFLMPTSKQSIQDGLTIQIDISEGIPEAEKLIETHQPDSILIFYRNNFIGHIPSLPGREKIQGHHLRSFLANDFSIPVAKALVLEGEIDMLPENYERILSKFNEAIEQNSILALHQ